MNASPQVLLQELKSRLAEIGDLRAASSVLHWDQTTHMPPGGSAARGRQLATLSRLAHEKFTDPAIGRLIEELQPYAAGLPYDSDEASLIRVVSRDYERDVRVPSDFVHKMRTASVATYEAWSKARPANSFELVLPHLVRMVELSQEWAHFFTGYQHIMDPMIDAADPGMTVASLQALFAQLREQLVPLVQAITSQTPPDDSCLHLRYPEAEQWNLARYLSSQIGYDLYRGCIDRTLHPYETRFSNTDVRISLRTSENDLANLLFGALHESGHAMYEQGVAAELEGTPLARGASSGMHESQSRLWENVVGRSRAFWTHYYPHLQAAFPSQLHNVPLEVFYRAINKVKRSLVRTEADEVTYNLHVIIRFDLEVALLEGRLDVADLPAAWRERYEADLGITPPDDADGCMQDTHWYGGRIGGQFQGYTLGNIANAQIFEAAVRVHPEIPDEIAHGQFDTLHNWLIESIYRHGRKFTPAELIERVTGRPLTIEPYMRYLRQKYGELYQL